MTNIKHCPIFIVDKMQFKHQTGVSTDTTEYLQQVKDIQKLSAPVDYDVDNMVQSDLPNKSEANVEIKSTTNNTQLNTKNTKSNNNNNLQKPYKYLQKPYKYLQKPYKYLLTTFNDNLYCQTPLLAKHERFMFYRESNNLC